MRAAPVVQLWPLEARPGWATVSAVGCLGWPVGGSTEVHVVAGPGSTSWRAAASWLRRTGSVPQRFTYAALYRAWMRHLIADAAEGGAAA
jgi:hypothetical protein